MLARIVTWAFAAATLLLNAALLHGENYPNKSVRIVTSEIGGSTDLAARQIAQGISPSLGQPVIVDNRGGGGTIPGEVAARANPDGYTLLFYSGILWLLPMMQDHVPYDAVKDFLPVTLATTAPNLLVVHPSVNVNSVRELIALAKAKPGELNYASGPAGSSPHLAAELFKSMAGVDVMRIGYKGGGPAMNALIGGQVQLMFPTTGLAAPHVKSGRLKALAVTSLQPSALAPGLPTVAASGLPGYESVGIYGVLVPAKTPRAVIDTLNRTIVKFINQPDAKARFLNAGVEVVGSTPEQFSGKIKSDMTTLGKVIKEGHIRAE